MNTPKEKILHYNNQEELFTALIRRHRLSFSRLLAHEWPARIAKAIRHLATTLHLLES